jgi:hypothetical protein
MFFGFELALNEDYLNEIFNERSVEYIFNPLKEYERLENNDKIALKHLVKASKALDYVFLKQDHSRNLDLKMALQEAALKGNTRAEKTLKLFKIFNGIEGNDGLSKTPVRLFKNLEQTKTKNIFPEKLTPEELIKYLKENVEEIPAILSFDTIVRRDGNTLKAIPYYIAFAREYKIAAKELLNAASFTTHEGFAKYLRTQAQALMSNDPEYSYKADTLWAKLFDCPLEFTIGRESYADTFTGSIVENIDFLKLLEKHNLTVKAKDFIGARTGIVDIEASRNLMDYKNHLASLAKLMPDAENYKQSINNASKNEINQTLVDVDLVYLSGDYSALRPGITLAQNLPNDDKLAAQLNCGNRNVFHKQIRHTVDHEKLLKLLNSLVDQSLHDLYDREADHLFTIGHELAHSLGPVTTTDGRDKKVSLGDGYGDIIEECKADVASLYAIDYFVKCNKYSQKLANKMLVTWAVDQMPLSEPDLTQAHRMRELMQLNYFIEKEAIMIKPAGKMNVNLDKMIPSARNMLVEVIEIQLEGSADRARQFVEKYGSWNETMKYISTTKQSLKPKPFKILKMPLAEKLLAEA